MYGLRGKVYVCRPHHCASSLPGPPTVIPAKAGIQPANDFAVGKLGTAFMLIAAIGDTLYAISVGKAGGFLSRSRIRALKIASGCF